MSTRVRIVYQHGGQYFAGKDAVTVLKKLGGFLGKATGWKRLEEIFLAIHPNYAHDEFWIFREPRRVKVDQSVYVQLCKYFGIGRTIHNKKILDKVQGILARLRRNDDDLNFRRPNHAGRIPPPGARRIPGGLDRPAQPVQVQPLDWVPPEDPGVPAPNWNPGREEFNEDPGR